VIRAPRPPGSGWLARRSFEHHLTHLPASYAILRAESHGLAHALYQVDGLAAARWSRVTGRPSVLSYMGIPEGWWLDAARLRRDITRRAAEGCTAVVALSQTVARAFRTELGIEPRVIAPGVDVEWFTPGGARAPEPTIFCAASLTEPAKRVPELVRAFGLVREQHPTARLLLSRPKDSGAGEHAVGDAAGVQLIDVDSREALRDAYRGAWASALPSVGEAFGLVLVESMACGTPVVGRRAGAIPEVVDSDAVGRLFEGAEEELAAALIAALDLAGDASTAPACRAHAQGFSTSRCVDAYLALYRELLDG
jgi:phosphatidylinositol alpha-mannosyltransferase